MFLTRWQTSARSRAAGRSCARLRTLPGYLCLVTVTSGQLLLSAASDSFLRRARWEGEIATGWRPHGDQGLNAGIDNVAGLLGFALAAKTTNELLSGGEAGGARGGSPPASQAC